MSVKRYIDTKFWSDSWVQSLNPSQKYFYLYLITHPDSNIAGVYECSVKKMCFDTGYNEDTVNNLLKFFQDEKKVAYYKNYVILFNFAKHQRINEKIEKGIKAVLDSLPIDYRYTIHRLCIDYGYTSNYLNLNLNLNKNLDLNENADAPSAEPTSAEVDTTTPAQKEYCQKIFDIWTSAGLPGAKDIFSFQSRDFKNALAYLKPYHSEEVIQACKNYIEVLEDESTWLTYKWTFDKFVQNKQFSNFLPDNFVKDNFKKDSFSKDVKPKAETPKKFFSQEPCRKCGKKKLWFDNDKQKYICDSCGASFEFEDIQGAYLNG